MKSCLRPTGKFLVLANLLTMAFSVSTLAFTTLPLGNALNSPLSFLSGSIPNEVVTTVGTVLDHRAFEPATGLGTRLGLDIGFGVNLVQLPVSLKTAFQDQGFNFSLPPFLPGITELNVHKGLSDSIDVGGSYLSFHGYTVWAFDFKWVFFHPEEGLTWAVRVSRTSTHLPIGSASYVVAIPQAPPVTASLELDLDTVTWNPEIVVSKQLGYADPYMGVGFRGVTGKINVTNNLGIDIPGLTSVDGGGSSLLAFIGLSMRVPNLGLRLTLEGGYSPAGYNSIGTKVSLSL